MPEVDYATIEFFQYFYLQNYRRSDVGRKTIGGVVLLPSHGHELQVQLNGAIVSLDLSRAAVYLRPRGAGGDAPPVWGRPTVPPGDDRLLKVNRLLPVRPPQVQKHLLTGSVPGSLNARVILSGGEFVGQPADDPKYQETEWVIRYEQGGGTQFHVQRLTDRLDFRVPADANLELVIEAGGSVLLQEPMAAGVTVRLTNVDVSPVSPLGELHTLLSGVLRDYGPEHLKPRRRERGIVFPRAATEPICGGAQGDPEPPNDPVDPPPPENG